MAKLVKIAVLVFGTIAVGYAAAWLLQEDKSKPPIIKPSKPDRNGKAPGKI